MVAPPLCPSCGALGVGERCARCGAQMKRAPADDGMLGITVPGLELDGADDLGKTPAAGLATGLAEDRRHRAASAYLALQPSETAVLQAASQILAGFIASGAVTADNENDVSDRAVKLATRMALVIEKYVQSDSEDW